MLVRHDKWRLYDMNIGLVGYGRMGKMIEQLALQKGWLVGAIIDPFSQEPSVTARKLEPGVCDGCSVVIDFSSPHTAVDNIRFFVEQGIPAVIGTTGWYGEVDAVRSFVEQKRGAIIYSGNFSIGVHVFLSIVRHAAHIVDALPDYDLLVSELHHAGKADSPSGTAQMLARAVLENVGRKQKIESGRLDRKRQDDELHVVSGRVGSIAGTHTVILDSPVDTIELTHRARSREGFAAGALVAAEWISSGKQGLFTLDDMLE